MPALDGLRALAVIGVLLFHDDRLPGGFLGVDLFFAVSGFLITGLLIGEHERSGRIDLIGFWGRRLRRLLPAALTLLVVTVIAFRLFADTGEWIMARNDAPWAQFYVANWHTIASGNGYWDSFAAPSAFEHLWSLAIEEQFYLVWPIVVAAALRRGTRTLGAITLAGTVASIIAMMLIFDGGDPTRVYMGTDTRAFSLLAGALFALPDLRRGVDRFVTERARSAVGVGVSAAVVLALMWVGASGDSDWLFHGGLAAHSVLSALLAALVFSGLPGAAALLGWRPIVVVGKLSYSLYLWHWPVFVFVSPERFEIDRWVLTLIRFVVSGLLAAASYVLVERPIRFRARWAHGSRGRVAFVTCSILTVAVWVAVPVPQTTNAVNDDALNAVLSTTSTTAATSTTTVPPATSVAQQTSTSTTTSSTTTTTTIVPLGPPVESLLWFGDSIAYDTWPALNAVLTATGIDAQSAAYGGVGIVPREGFDEPMAYFIEALDQSNPDLVVMQLSLWDGYESPEDQVAAFTELGRIIDERGLRLALVTLPVRSDEQADPGEVVLVANAERFAESHESVVILDQREVFGDVFKRDIDGDGNPERKRDGVHLCPTGALSITVWLIKQLGLHYEGIGFPETSDWIRGDWRTDERYDDPPGACAAL